MPSAGRIAWNTSRSLSLTTKRHSEVSVRTLTSTLTPKPKNALVSPRTHQGTRNAVFAAMPSRPLQSGLKCRDERRGLGDPAEDAALRGDHPQAGLLELREVGAD